MEPFMTLNDIQNAFMSGILISVACILLGLGLGVLQAVIHNLKEKINE